MNGSTKTLSPRYLIVHNGTSGTLYLATKRGKLRPLKTGFIIGGPLAGLRACAERAARDNGGTVHEQHEAPAPVATEADPHSWTREPSRA